MRRISSNLIGAAAVAALAILYLIHVRDLPWGAAGAPEAGFVPKSLGWLLLILCLLLILREAVRRKPPSLSPANEEKAPGGYGPTAAAMAALISYPLLMNHLGFLAATGLFLLAVFRIIRYRTWGMSVLAAGAITLASYIIFTVLLGVHFPRGIFG
jgi:putative tricarboxylic transport membrane protein